MIIRDRKYLDWLRSQPCCITGVEGQTEPAHTFKSIGGGGMGLKSSDSRALPIHFELHRLQHSMSEAQFWREALMRDTVLLKQMVLLVKRQRRF